MEITHLNFLKLCETSLCSLENKVYFKYVRFQIFFFYSFRNTKKFEDFNLSDTYM